jgi:tripartite-type tricarboxylate transporter receptor subunit TctC
LPVARKIGLRILLFINKYLRNYLLNIQKSFLSKMINQTFSASLCSCCRSKGLEWIRSTFNTTRIDKRAQLNAPSIRRQKVINSNRLLALLFAAGAACLALPQPSLAQDYPNKSIRLVIPYPPGGGTDYVGRVVGTKVAELTKWTVILENRPGAGGNLAAEAVAKSAPDGYTLLLAQTDSVMVSPWLNPSVGYDTLKSFTPVVHLTITPGAIVSATTSTIRTPADMIAKGKTTEGLRWATAGAGTFGDLLGEQYKKAMKINLVNTAYKGAAPALTDLMGGHVDVALLSLGSVLPQVKTGKLHAVAVTAATRANLLPDTPTLAESGATGMDGSIWVGIFVPVGTPMPIVQKLNAEFNRALQQPDVKEKIVSVGVDVVGGSVETYTEFVKTDFARWGKIVKDSGIKLQ